MTVAWRSTRPSSSLSNASCTSSSRQACHAASSPRVTAVEASSTLGKTCVPGEREQHLAGGVRRDRLAGQLEVGEVDRVAVVERRAAVVGADVPAVRHGGVGRERALGPALVVLLEPAARRVGRAPGPATGDEGDQARGDEGPRTHGGTVAAASVDFRACRTADGTPPAEWLDELAELIRIPSVSADPAHADDVRRAAEWVCDFVRAAGGECELVETDAQPLAVGELRASRDADAAPTVLLYGHVDVQPPAPLDQWESPPFEPEIRGEWLYGRGVADDKGNLYLLLKAAAQLADEGALPVNVRIACDAEEEIGGHSIVDYIAADERGADACVIYDGGMPRRDVPAFMVGTRGLVYFHVRLRSGERDLHSGVYGGAALNAVHALMDTLRAVTEMPAELTNGIVPATAEEVAAWDELDSGEAALADQGARPADGRAAEEFYLRTFAGAAVDVNGIVGGEPLLQKTVLPVEAEANVSIRLAPGQDAEEVALAFERILRDAAPGRRDRRRRALVARARGPRRPERGGREARPGRVRGRARDAAAPHPLGRDAADRAGARRPRHPDDPLGLRPARRGTSTRRTSGCSSATSRSACRRRASCSRASPRCARRYAPTGWTAEWSCSSTSHSWPNRRIASMIGRSAAPFAVSSYSTRGGDSA